MEKLKNKDRLTNYETKQITIHSKNLTAKSVPWITLSGIWLADLGFSIGEKVNVIVREHLLIIELPVGKDKEVLDSKATLAEVKRQLKKLTR